MDIRMKNTFRLNRPMSQNIVCGLILFCLPGIYTALTALGAGGGKPSSSAIANQTNAILYGVFIVFACMGGTIVNLFGPRLALMIGTLGYPLYVGGLWYYDDTGAAWFPLFAGAVLGALSGVLWTCVYMIAYAYAEESQKGLFLAVQWALRSFGASVGAAIAFAVNYGQSKPTGVSSAVYIVFIVLQMSSLLLSGLLIVKPTDVVRDDGTRLARFDPPTFKTEIKKLQKCFTDKSILLLTPAMIVCEMPLGTLSTVNGFFLDLRSRALASMCFQIIQVFGPLLLVWIFDSKIISSRRMRGLLGVGFMGAMAIGTCIGMYVWLFAVNYDKLGSPPGRDWGDSGAPAFFALYILFGWVYSGFQMAVGWCSSSLSNDPTKLAQYAGYTRACTSLGMCISFALASQSIPLLTQLSIEFSLYVIGLCGMIYVVLFKIKETNYLSEEGVIPPQEDDKCHNHPLEEHAASKDQEQIDTKEP